METKHIISMKLPNNRKFHIRNRKKTAIKSGRFMVWMHSGETQCLDPTFIGEG